MKDTLNIEGLIKIRQYVKGKLINEFEFYNIITNDGFVYLQKFFTGQSGIINKLGLGDDNTPVDPTDTILVNRRILLDVTRDISSPKMIHMLATVPEGSFPITVNFKEAGLIYKTASEEVLVTRVVFPQVVYQTTDASLGISYYLKLI